MTLSHGEGFTVRRAKPDDAPAIARVSEACGALSAVGRRGSCPPFPAGCTRSPCALAETMPRLGFARIGVWVLRDNPARGFYERLGGEYSTEKDIETGGAVLREVALGCSDVRRLCAAKPPSSFGLS